MVASDRGALSPALWGYEAPKPHWKKSGRGAWRGSHEFQKRPIALRLHVFLGDAENDYGYMGRARISQNMSGVTGACLLIKKSLWDKLKGMDERFTVAYNDVDLCLAAEKAGYLCVYDAFVKMYHYESKTRGSDLSDANKRRLDRERDHLINKWGKRMDRDPYYNDNLNFDNGYYEL